MSPVKTNGEPKQKEVGTKAIWKQTNVKSASKNREEAKLIWKISVPEAAVVAADNVKDTDIDEVIKGASALETEYAAAREK